MLQSQTGRYISSKLPVHNECYIDNLNIRKLLHFLQDLLLKEENLEKLEIPDTKVSKLMI